MPATDDWARRKRPRPPVAKAKPSEWYDDAISDPASLHLLDSPESPWLELYRAAALFVAGYTRPPAVIDVGCGSGRFAALVDPAHGLTQSYLGLDFSPRMLDEAKRHTRERATHSLCLFYRFDARDPASRRVHLSNPNAVYVILEVLEHLDDDLDLLRALPAGARVIFSVPTADSESHVRTFPTCGAACQRYGASGNTNWPVGNPNGPLDISTYRFIESRNPPEGWHLFTATAKGTRDL